jgi:hypothetical protein
VTQDDFNAFATTFLADTVKVLEDKGADYARENGHFHNFDTAADFAGVESDKVWAIYAYKHWSAIVRYARDGEVASENILGRLQDLINYCVLFAARIHERNNLAADHDPGYWDTVERIVPSLAPDGHPWVYNACGEVPMYDGTQDDPWLKVTSVTGDTITLGAGRDLDLEAESIARYHNLNRPPMYTSPIHEEDL